MFVTFSFNDLSQFQEITTWRLVECVKSSSIHNLLTSIKTVNMSSLENVNFELFQAFFNAIIVKRLVLLTNFSSKKVEFVLSVEIDNKKKMFKVKMQQTYLKIDNTLWIRLCEKIFLFKINRFESFWKNLVCEYLFENKKYLEKFVFFLLNDDYCNVIFFDIEKAVKHKIDFCHEILKTYFKKNSNDSEINKLLEKNRKRLTIK